MKPVYILVAFLSFLAQSMAQTPLLPDSNYVVKSTVVGSPVAGIRTHDITLTAVQIWPYEYATGTDGLSSVVVGTGPEAYTIRVLARCPTSGTTGYSQAGDTCAQDILISQPVNSCASKSIFINIAGNVLRYRCGPGVASCPVSSITNLSSGDVLTNFVLRTGSTCLYSGPLASHGVSATLASVDGLRSNPSTWSSTARSQYTSTTVYLQLDLTNSDASTNLNLASISVIQAEYSLNSAAYVSFAPTFHSVGDCSPTSGLAVDTFKGCISLSLPDGSVDASPKPLDIRFVVQATLLNSISKRTVDSDYSEVTLSGITVGGAGLLN